MNIHSDNHRFGLPRKGKKHTCPNCGDRKSFKRYVDVTTGRELDDNCGICDHVNRCGYHYPPRELFRDNPQLKDDLLHPNESLENPNIDMRNALRSISPINNAEQPQTEFFPLSYAEKGAERDSTFSVWFMGLPFDEDVKKKVLADYFVGATEKDIIVEGQNRGKAAVFWMIDELMRVHDAKLIAYNPDGHRAQGWGNSMRSICKKSGKGPQLEQTEKVLFGLHLINRYPEKTVYIVESEKSALICACQFPQYLWLATGGCGNLQASKLKPLMNRKIVVCPDSGEYQEWCEKMKASGHQQYDVLDIFETYEPNTDIADVILSEYDA